VFKPTIALLAAVLALVIIASGCGGASNGSGDSAASSGAAPAAAQPAYGGGAAAVVPAKPVAAASAKTVKVSVGDNVFQPAAIHVKVGQKITWSQDGQIAHTVTATDGAKFDSGALEPGKSFSYTAKQAGTIKYLCQFHQGMTGTIVVD
jgi:plastocyanin